MRIAFLGAGIMGAPMARCLLRDGYELSVWNRSPEKAAPLRCDGARVASTIGDAVRDAELVLLMLSTGDVCNHVLFGGRGVASAISPGVRVAVMSSIPPEIAKSQASRLSGIGVGYVDAPVSGGESGAIDGRLSIMAGGSVSDVSAIEPVLSSMGALTHVGEAGAGSLAKLANQLIVGVTIAAVAEAFLLARDGGVKDLAALKTALTGGFADSAVLRQHGQRMIDGDFVPGAHAETQLKDLATSMDLSESLGVNFAVLATVHRLYSQMCQGPASKLDHSALFLQIENEMRQKKMQN